MKCFFLAAAAMSFAGCASAQTAIERSFITDPIAEFPQFDGAATQTIDTVDHSKWSRFLSVYIVNSNEIASSDDNDINLNLVKYSEVTDADAQSLKDYISAMEKVAPSALSRDEQLAFWINVYNAVTIAAILEEYPVSSIRDIKSGPFDFKGPWNDERVTIEGTSLTLDDIENKIIRPLFQDPRIHYAVNCASVGCPNLRHEAYTGETLDGALDEQAREYINDPRGVTVTKDGLILSKIFIWYRDDFGSSDDDIVAHIVSFADAGLKEAIATNSEIDGYAYDWSLNDAADF